MFFLKILIYMFLFHIFASIKFPDKDWDDIKFGVENHVDYYAVSFVKDAQVVHELKDYLRSNNLSYFINSNTIFCFHLLISFYCISRLQS
jgi:hypothetical protein